MSEQLERLEADFQKAHEDYRKTGSADAWSRIWLLVYNACRAMCVNLNFKYDRDNLDDLIQDSTLVCINKIKKDPDLKIKKLSSWCYWPCFEALAERQKKKHPVVSYDQLIEDSHGESTAMQICANTNVCMNIQSIAKTLGKNGCLLFCDLMLMGKDPALALKDYNDYVEQGIIFPDCWVKDHNKLLAFYGYKGRYIRVSTRPQKGLYIACYKNGTVTHFVLVNADLNHSIYDPLGKSNSVIKGVELKEWRVIV